MGDGRDAAQGAQSGHDVAQKFQSGIKQVEQGQLDKKAGKTAQAEGENKQGMAAVADAMKAFGDEWQADANSPARRAAVLKTIQQDLQNSDDPIVKSVFGNAQIVGYDPETKGMILKTTKNGQEKTVVLGSDLKIYDAAAPKDDPRTKTTPTKPNGEFDPDSAFGDRYNKLNGGKTDVKDVKLPPEAEEQVKKDLEQYKKQIDDNNFSFDIKSGEGPVPAMERMRKEISEAVKSGKIKEEDLTPQQKALLGMKDVLTEGRRIRDRDFNDPDFVEKHKKYGGDGHIYAVKDDNAVKRWSDAEVKKMMDAKEQQLRQDAAQKEIERQKQAEIERQKQEKSKGTEQQTAAAIDKSVPSEEIIKKAQTASGIEGDPKDIREKMKAQIATEVQAGTLDPTNLPNPPRVGTVFVATGAVTPEQLKAGLDKQAQLKAANPDKAPPRIGDILKDMYKDRADAIDKSSKFYDVMRSESLADQKTPSTDVIGKAQKSAPVDGAGSADDIYGRMRTQVAQDVLNNKVKPDDLKNGPTKEEVYVGLGIIKPEELDAARAEQAKRADAAAKNSQPAPSTEDVIKDMYKDRKDKFAAADEYAKALQAEQQAADKAKAEAEARQKDQEAQLDKAVPDADSIKGALDKAKIDADPADVRQKMKAQMADDLANNELSPDDLKDGPTFESALVATGALTPDELKAARAQAEKDNADNPDLNDALQKLYKDNPDKLKKIQAAGDFYNALKPTEKTPSADDQIEKAVPQADAIKAAMDKSGVTGDPAKIREGIKAQMAQDLKDQAITTDDIAKGPDYEQVLVGSGVLTPDELNKARAEQDKREKAATDAKTDPPDYADTLKDMYKDRAAQIDAAGKLYEALKKPDSTPPANSDEAIEKAVPNKDSVKTALDTSGLKLDPDQVRNAMKAQMADDLKNNLIKPDDITNGPSFDDALVATGALTPDELKAARAQAQKDNASAPDLKATLQKMYAGKNDKLDAIKKADAFFTALTTSDDPPG